MFERELATYERLKPELQAQPGRFALIKGDDLVGVYNTYRDALQVGYDRFGLDGFFLKEMDLVEPVFWRD
jgi:hypothetical protein